MCTPSCLVIEEHPQTTSEKCLINGYFVGAIFKTGHTYFKFVIVCNIELSRDLERTRFNSSRAYSKDFLCFILLRKGPVDQ